MKKIGLVTTVLALSLFVGCTKKDATTTAEAPSTTTTTLTNNELKVGISQEFENFNPLIASMMATTYMQRMVNRTLVVIDADGKWVPQLAKQIPTLENGGAKITEKGGKKILTADWEILENAVWGDGKPVICEDFEFAIKVASSPNVGVGEKETYTQVKSMVIDSKNPKKCTFTYDKVKWDFYQLGTLFPLPKHLEEPVFKKFGGQKEGYEKNSIYSKEPTNVGLYNGPYVLTEIQLGDHVTFTPNPKFYGEQAKIKKIIVKLIPNTGTLEANLRSGTIDLISVLGLALDQALAFDKKIKEEKLGYTVLFQPSAVYEHIDLNLDHPALKDIRVRKALHFAINKEDLVNALFEGKQQPALHNITPNDPWYTADSSKIVTYKYSKREADRLLDEAGWKMGTDGIRTKDGKKLSFTLMTTAGNKTRELVQVYLQNQWKQVGVEVNSKNEPARVFFGETTKKRNFDSMALFAWISSPESSPKSTFSSKNIPTAKTGWSGQNYMGWKNAKVDTLLESLDTEFKPEKRVEIIHEVLKAYTDEVPVLPLYYRSDVAVIPTQMKGYKLTGHQFPETNEVEKWTVE
ncbi:MAG: ABC transporter substrate-binding protein [Bdellovibrionales bacterium RIFCSPHIGHO2_01_FULL_40_29]|nr:MAG: ABC transporter substrate-binding protein [Bdellovibrionales bacterium RIFCSPHIGHO2_01_FULL_40_29]OFZ34408.1 MAG: ABC transporter substrate-binding protein [Bdellovibrionales bacterium RIFCSPHIGHO2_02_FULL_40_15]